MISPYCSCETITWEKESLIFENNNIVKNNKKNNNNSNNDNNDTMEAANTSLTSAQKLASLHLFEEKQIGQNLRLVH